ncbi:hypothetical protein [Thalassospira lucentensis]|uniref:hypothetical protein n=1 Tax=Thalassospira lucentensis TaxID=168935 RepID=UPI0003B4186D|nr:hypothetical protein [Thalassospira lucentensis]RCK21955.1 hypothetical protein TH1_17585 [Thalassospira lucentensis MCCC 1A00383 = DSM 14000]
MDSEGITHWIRPDGTITPAPPDNFGVIGNGHFIKLGETPGEKTVWDQNFEPAFDQADSNFPAVISWLQSLTREDRYDAKMLNERFLTADASDKQIACLVECIVSLAVRSPMNREASVSLAESLRGRLQKQERNAIMKLNMRDSQQQAVSLIGTRGKFAVLYSPDSEFIFGDGFFHNIKSPVYQSLRPKILVPITPEISVVYARPMAYQTEPRLSTLTLTPTETTALNETVQIYSKNALFYRSQKPTLGEAFQRGVHLEYSGTQNSVEQLITALPGMEEERRRRDQAQRGIFF